MGEISSAAGNMKYYFELDPQVPRLVQEYRAAITIKRAAHNRMGNVMLKEKGRPSDFTVHGLSLC